MLNIKIFLLITYVASTIYTHLRGVVRLPFFKQLTDHSTLMAPINAFMYLFSAVPKTPYIDVKDFPELKILSDEWQTIKEEALNLYNNENIVSSNLYNDIGFNSFFRRGWKRFYLKWYNKKPMESAKALCPKTLELIQKIPNINAAMFALLPKQSFLFKHRDPYAGSLRYHLGLITPNSDECYITVDGKNYSWRDGEAVMFDETYVHQAQNNTQEDRIILFCDIKRPLNNRIANYINTLISNTLMRAASSSNVPTEAVGGINRIFKYLYKIRIIGKKLKAYNKNLYYCIKYILLMLILGLWFFK